MRVDGWEFHGLQGTDETPIRPPLDSFGPADPPIADPTSPGAGAVVAQALPGTESGIMGPSADPAGPGLAVRTMGGPAQGRLCRGGAGNSRRPGDRRTKAVPKPAPRPDDPT